MDSSDQGGDPERAAEGATLMQHRWRWLREGLLQGTVISIIVAIALSIVTIRADDSRSAQERRLALEEDWRRELKNEAEFPRATLQGLDLSGVYAPSVGLVGANLRSTSFAKAGLVGARFDGADATGANFRGAQLNDAGFAGAILRGSDFSAALLNGVDLRDADLRGSDLRGAELFRADLRGVDLTHTRVSDNPRALRYVCFDEQTKWPPGHSAPPAPLCRRAVTEPRGLPGAHYQLEAFALVAGGGPRTYADEAPIAGEAVVLIAFDNIGVSPLQSVKMIIEVPVGLRAARVRLINGNFLEGYEYSDDAIQGAQVNIDLGTYNGGTNAHVEVTVARMPTTCGVQEITAYAQPDGLGAISDTARLTPPC